MKLLKKEKTLVTFLEIFVVVSVLVCDYYKALYLLLSGDVNALEHSAMTTVEPQYNELPRDCQNFFRIKRIRYIEGLFHILG